MRFAPGPQAIGAPKLVIWPRAIRGGAQFAAARGRRFRFRHRQGPGKQERKQTRPLSTQPTCFGPRLQPLVERRSHALVADYTPSRPAPLSPQRVLSCVRETSPGPTTTTTQTIERRRQDPTNAWRIVACLSSPWHDSSGLTALGGPFAVGTKGKPPARPVQSQRQALTTTGALDRSSECTTHG